MKKRKVCCFIRPIIRPLFNHILNLISARTICSKISYINDTLLILGLRENKVPEYQINISNKSSILSFEIKETVVSDCTNIGHNSLYNIIFQNSSLVFQSKKFY